MSSRSRTADSGLGSSLRRVPLRGRVTVDGVAESAELCLTDQGLWLVAPRGSADGAICDLLEEGQLRYERGRTSDRLLVNGYELATPPGRSNAVRETIALGRLRAQGGSGSASQSSHAWPAKGSHLVRHLDARSCALLAGELEPAELVVAFVASTERAELPSALATSAPGRWYWLITDSRVRLIALSELGDVESREVDVKAARLISGRLLLPDASAIVFRQATLVGERLLALSRMPRGERLSAAALLEWSNQHVAWAQRLLTAAADEHADAAFALEIVACDAKLSDPQLDLGRALESLQHADAPAETLAALVRGWNGSSEAASLLLAKLRPLGDRAEPWALELHRWLLPDKPKTAAVLDFAEHLLAAERAVEVRRLLGGRVELSASELELATAEPAPGLRSAELARGYQLAARAAQALGEDTLPFLWALARLEPLSQERLEALRVVAPPELRRRVEAALAALAAGGLGARANAELAADPLQVSKELLELRLPHPLARARASATVQGVLAHTGDPDRELLRSWCERLSPRLFPWVAAAAERARVVLGLPEPELFVSRGDRSLGVRAFAGRAPLVVVGGSHLEPSSSHALDPIQLAFALGAELTHVRFGHERATSREVWMGALGKARIGVELALAALPLARSLDLGARATRLLDRVPATAMQRALSVFKDLQRSFDRPELGGNELGRRHEELVTAHRWQQLTADRGGLIIAGELRGPLRAMFALRSDHQDLFAEIAANGLGHAARESLLDHPELLLRLRALVSFYLSADFATLLGASSK